jgi:hypothetical protein
VFCTILTINIDYFLKQRQPVDLCNGEVLCFLCGTDWIIKYYVVLLRLQRVKRHCNTFMTINYAFSLFVLQAMIYLCDFVFYIK